MGWRCTHRLREETEGLVPTRELLVGSGRQTHGAAAANEIRVEPKADGVPHHVVGRLPLQRVQHTADGSGEILRRDQRT